MITLTNWDEERKFKQISRQLATDFPKRKSALFMPAHTALCVKTAEKQQMIHPDYTKLILVERDKEKIPILQQNVQKWNKRIFQQDLHTVVLNQKLDYAWLDLNGTVTQHISNWIHTELSNNLEERSIVCLTQGYCWRNNPWLKKIHDTATGKYGDEYAAFRYSAAVLSDPLLTFPAFLMASLLRDWKIEIMTPYHYRDTIDMVLFRFKVFQRKIPSIPLLLGDLSVQPVVDCCFTPACFLKEKKMKTVPTAAAVIDAICNATTPAEKAHATRKFNAYVDARVEEGKNPIQIRAAIKAHVTRRTTA